MVDYVLYTTGNDHNVNSTLTASWANARSGSSGLTDTVANTLVAGTFFSAGPNYSARQTFLPFDTTGIIAGTVSNAHLFLNFTTVPTSLTLDVAVTTFDTGTAPWIAGASLPSPIASPTISATGMTDISLSSLTSIPQQAEYCLMVYGPKQRTNTTPTVNESCNFSSSRATGTANDPRLEFTVTPSSVNLTMPVDTGTYAVSGSAIGLRVSRRLQIDSGTYSLSGATIGFTRSQRLTIDTGTYALSGSVISFQGGNEAQFNTGTYSLTGNPINFQVALSLRIDSGSYALAGSNIDLSANMMRTIAFDTGAYVLSEGQIGFKLRTTPVVPPGNDYGFRRFPRRPQMRVRNIPVRSR